MSTGGGVGFDTDTSCMAEIKHEETKKFRFSMIPKIPKILISSDNRGRLIIRCGFWCQAYGILLGDKRFF